MSNIVLDYIKTLNEKEFENSIVGEYYPIILKKLIKETDFTIGELKILGNVFIYEFKDINLIIRGKNSHSVIYNTIEYILKNRIRKKSIDYRVNKRYELKIKKHE